MTTIERRTAPKRPGETKTRPAASKAAKADPKTKADPKSKVEPSKALVPAKTKAPAVQPKAAVVKTAQARAAGRPRAPFVLLILCLLGGALVSLLLLNTVLARDAYTLTALEKNVRLLDQEKQALTNDVARQQAPEALARAAANLGMRPASEFAWIETGNGRVTGGKVRPIPNAAAAAAAAAGVIGVPGAIVPGDGIPGWTGVPDVPVAPQVDPARQQNSAPQPAQPQVTSGGPRQNAPQVAPQTQPRAVEGRPQSTAGGRLDAGVVQVPVPGVNLPAVP